MVDNSKPSIIDTPSVLMYQTEDGKTRLQILIEGETVWMTQAQIADLYQTTIPNISIHIRNIHRFRTLEEYINDNYLKT